MRESQRQSSLKYSRAEGASPGGLASRVLRPNKARSALVVSAVIAVTSVGGLWPLEQQAFAQEKAGAGGAPAAPEKAGAGGGGQESAEKSGAGGGAAAAPEKGGDKAAAAPVPVETKVVIYVEGPKAAEIKSDIEKSLPAGVTAVPEGPFVEALKKQGLVPLTKSIKGPKERADASPKLQLAAQEAGVQAAIIASVPAAKGGKYDIAILIVPSDSPQPLASTNVKTPSKGDQKRTEAVAGVVSPAISGIVPITAPAPEQPAEPKAEEPKAEEPKKPEEPKAEEPQKPEGPATNTFLRGKFLLEAGLGTQGRSFFYIQPLSGDNVRPYSLLAAPHLFLHADYYPFAGPGDSFLNNLGLTAIVGGSLGIQSTINDQTGIKTSFFHARIGPKVRIPLGAGDKAPLLTGEVAYSRWAFTFEDPNGVSPSFTYQSIRPGVGMRLPTGPVTMLFEAGFHFVNDAGALTARFPNSSVTGLDAQLGVAVPFSATFEGRFSLNYNRYRGNLKADLDQNSTGYEASGSVDQFFGLHVGVAIAP
jgi:hypothetical protein